MAGGALEELDAMDDLEQIKVTANWIEVITHEVSLSWLAAAVPRSELS